MHYDNKCAILYIALEKVFLFELFGGNMRKIKNYFTNVKSELKKVRWISFKELFKNVVTTLAFIIFFCGFFYLIDLLFAFIKGLF